MGLATIFAMSEQLKKELGWKSNPGIGPFICGQCGARFHSMKELDKHLAKYHPEAFASLRKSSASNPRGESRLNDFLPQHPMKGPPLPKIWGIKWPGK